MRPQDVFLAVTAAVAVCGLIWSIISLAIERSARGRDLHARDVQLDKLLKSQQKIEEESRAEFVQFYKLIDQVEEKLRQQVTDSMNTMLQRLVANHVVEMDRLKIQFHNAMAELDPSKQDPAAFLREHGFNVTLSEHPDALTKASAPYQPAEDQEAGEDGSVARNEGDTEEPGGTSR